MAKSSWNRPLLWVSLAGALAGCSTAPENQGSASSPLIGVENTTGEPVPRVEPPSRSGNPDTYKVFGKRYRVKETSEGYREQGVASWYGWDFHGRKTSSGPRYDMFDLTAAHKTLPIPTYVRVTNLENGRNVVVKVNDRGPFVGRRILDLSYAAANRLDMLGRGTAQVEVVALEPYQFVPHLAARRADARERLASRLKRPELKPQLAAIQLAQAEPAKVDSAAPALPDIAQNAPEPATTALASNAPAADSATLLPQSPLEREGAMELPAQPKPLQPPQVAGLDQASEPSAIVPTPVAAELALAKASPVDRDVSLPATTIVDRPALARTPKPTQISQVRNVDRMPTRTLAQARITPNPTLRPAPAKLVDKAEREPTRLQPPLRLAAADPTIKAGETHRPANAMGNKHGRTNPAKTENAAKRPAEERPPRVLHRDARPQASLGAQQDSRVVSRDTGTAKPAGIRLVGVKAGRGRIMTD